MTETEGRTVLEADTSIQLANIQWNGRNCIPVFSSLSRLQALLRTESSFVALNALDLMRITRGAELIMNPGSDYGKEFTRDEIASLLDGSIWQPTGRYVAEEPVEVTIGQPANYPKELADALARYFKGQKTVKRAFLAHFFNPARDEKPHTLVAIDYTGEWEPIMAGAGMVAQGTAVPDPPVDFLPLEGKGGIEAYFQKDCTPFYQRKRFGIF